MDDFFWVPFWLMVFVCGIAYWRHRVHKKRREFLQSLELRVQGLEKAVSRLNDVLARLSIPQERTQPAAAPAEPPKPSRAPHAVTPVLPKIAAPPVAPKPIAQAPAIPLRPAPVPTKPSPPVPTFGSYNAPGATAPTERRSITLEETVGANWLNKMGIVILVLGVALLLSYQLRTMGPAGKVVIGYLVGATLLGLGVFAESKERYRILARGGIGGGWALLFFTTYAMYHVQAARVLSSQMTDLVLMLVVAAAMVAHTLRYRSQVATGLAFLLAFSTVTISRVDVYSLTAGAVLSLALAVICVRMKWYELEVFGILASYANHFLWLRPIIEAMGGHRRPFPEFFPSAGILIFYYLVYRVSYVLRRPETREQEATSTLAALLNPAFLLALLKYQSLHPEWAFWALLVLGGLELGFGLLCASRKRRDAFVVLAILASAFLVAAFPFRYSGTRLSILWIAESEALFLAGVLTREIVFRRTGMVAALIAAGQMIAYDAARVYGTRMDGADLRSDPRLGILFLTAALVFYFNSHWASRRWPDLFRENIDDLALRRMSYIGGVLLFIGAWISFAESWTAVAWGAIGLLLAVIGKWRKARELSVQGDLLFVAALVRVATINFETGAILGHGLSVRLVTIGLVALLLYVGSRYSGGAEYLRAYRIPEAYTWFGSTLVAVLAWYELRSISVALAWAVLGIVLFELGMAKQSSSLRWQAYVALGSAFARMSFVNLNAEGIPGQVSPRVYTVLPLAAVFYYHYERLRDRREPFLAGENAYHIDALFSYFATITVAALMRFELDLDWVAAAWAALAVILLVASWRTGRGVWRTQALLLALLTLFRGGLHNLYERSYFPASFWHGRVATTGAIIAILLFVGLPVAFQMKRPLTGDEKDSYRNFELILEGFGRYPEQMFFFVPVILLTALLAVEMRSGMITVAWGLESVAVFLFALVVNERSFRLTGLGLLLLCVGKIIVVDAWGLNPRDRYVTFIILGSLLLLVSFLYTRHRETLRQYL